MDLYGERELTKKEFMIVTLLHQGLMNKEIAALVGTTENVVKNYLRVIFDKLGFHNRVEVALWFEEKFWEKENEVS